MRRKVELSHDLMAAIGLVGFVVSMGMLLWILTGD